MHRFSTIALAMLIALSAHAASAQSVALTIDDAPNMQELARLTPAQRNAAMLAALAKHKVKAALFVTAGYGANRPQGNALVRA